MANPKKYEAESGIDGTGRSPIVPSNGRIHPTAIIEKKVSIGAATTVWDHVHIRKNTVIGEGCILGEKTYIAYDVSIGNQVKINAFVYVCTGVTIEDRVMVGAGTIFTNDRYPRTFDGDGRSLKPSGPTKDTLQTIVRHGATIGAACTIGPGLDLGPYCMVGMGSVVTRRVLPNELVYGNPARSHGFVCICGVPLAKKAVSSMRGEPCLACLQCGRQYGFTNTDSTILSCLSDSIKPNEK